MTKAPGDEAVDIDHRAAIPLVEEYQCPGCVIGSDTRCGKFKQVPTDGSCSAHVPGTTILGLGRIYLGLPRGFNRVGTVPSDRRSTIHIFPKGSPPPAYDRLNVAVWAMEHQGNLLVRCYQPRLNLTWIDIIEGGTLALVPDAIDVSKFIDEID